MQHKSKQLRQQNKKYNVAKCNLGKVRLEPMRSAVVLMALCDLWGVPHTQAAQVFVVQYI